jgi:hypothetical protein
MRKLILALVLTTALSLALAAVAAADPGNVQVSGQSATTSQQSGAASSATQIDPSNTNISIRVLSPGDDGSVSQSNTAASTASSGNQAATTQNANQTAAGPGIQTAQQQAGTDQLSLALSEAAQLGASNVNAPVRVLSPGDDGSVTQGNSVGSQASSGNTATTGQTATQGQSSACSCTGSGSGVQTANQSAGTGQSSGAASTATQDHPSNTDVSIRVLSPGGDGSVTQANTAGSQATSGNTATTGQTATQNQGSTSCSCSGSGSGIQSAHQSAGTGQESGALSTAMQDHPSNTNVSIRVLSPGDDGSVSQANTVGSTATSGNSATTTQNATQTQAGSGSGCGCTTTPVLQAPATPQADVPSDAPAGAANQSNTAGSSAQSGNLGSTGQNATQTTSGSGIQTGDQSADTDQSSVALSGATQIDPSNTAGSTRVLSPGDDGSVSQANTVGSTATSGNSATTTQTSTQSQGGSCGCEEPISRDVPSTSSSSSYPAIQVAGQQAETTQGSFAGSAAGQAGASNDASPVRVLSPGDGGTVSQSNTVGSSATSGNSATTTQTAGQSAAGSGCGCGGSAIQVAGQKADTDQGSLALSGAVQVFGHGKSDCGCGGGSPSGNTASPVRVWSPGSDGDVTQANTVGSSATSGNSASTNQGATQNAGGSAIQVLGQDAKTGQGSFAGSLAAQLGASNDASPVRVESPGGGGSVSQQNNAGSTATSGNAAATTQTGSQAAAMWCGCAQPIQVLGQQSDTEQLSKALSAAFQLAPANSSSPTRVWSCGCGGSALQANTSSSRGDSGNRAGTDGEAMQAS